MLITLIFIIACVVAVMIFLRSARFGAVPSGDRQHRIQAQPNYKENSFKNQSFTPDLAEGYTMPGILKDFLFNKSKHSKPSATLPAHKIDLFALKPEEQVLVWFGHSSYFIQTDGKRILVDPVFSGSASPVGFTTRAFAGSDVYGVEDMPELDYLVLTHDHYDHLDYKTVLQLKTKAKQVITSLGVGAHLEMWGYEPDKIKELVWNESYTTGEFIFTGVPGRHFSGRKFKRNQTLWQAFVLKTPTLNIFLGGDSGYDTHFKTIGEQFGPFDLVILECGQYNLAWKYIHMLPPEIVQAAKDLQAKVLLPVHWGKFSLALHAWNEPILAVSKIAQEQGVAIMTPMIGQKVNIKGHNTFTEWYRAPELSA